MSSSPRVGRSIGQRMLAILTLVLMLSLAGSAIGWWSLYQVAQQTKQMMDNALVAERAATDWYRNVTNGVVRTSAIVMSSDTSLVDFFAPQAAESTRQSAELQKLLATLCTAPDEVALLAEIAVVRKEYLERRDDLMALKKDGNAQRVRQLFDENFQPTIAKFQQGLAHLAQLQRNKFDALAIGVEQANERARISQIIFALIAVGVGICLSLWLTRSITRSLRSAVDVAHRIAKLDLTQPVEGHDRDETGHLLSALAEMQQSLQGLVLQVQAATGRINTASSEIATGNQDFADRTEQTASSLQQASSSMEQLTATVHQSASAAHTANDLAASAANVATRGGEVVGQVVSTMESISNNAKQINDIISVIDGIAFQTNILALNAAVEAARAGENGQGFAVVASEVRSLASRSAQAAKEIKSLIGVSVKNVQSGAQLVQDAGRTMNDILASVKRVSDIIGEIAASASEQSSGIGQINSAVALIDQMTQRNAALVQQGASASASLKDEAGRLATAVAQFKTKAA